MRQFLVLSTALLMLTLGPAIFVTAQESSSDDEWLNELAEDTWRYLSSDWATDNHLPWSWRSVADNGGSYVNPTEIGLYLVSYLAAYDMRQTWSPSWGETEAEVMAILDQLRAWQTGSQDSPTHSDNAYGNSVFYQWYWVEHTPPFVGVGCGEGKDDPKNELVPSIDNAFLAASLLTVREYAETYQHLDIAYQANAILNDMDFRLWYDSSRSLFLLGGCQNPLAGIEADYLSNENRIINYIARALNQLNAEEYAASLTALQRPPRTYNEIQVDAVAWDGSYFTYVSPGLFVHEAQTSYGHQTVDPATLAQIQYAQDQGYAAWGLSDCYSTGLSDYIHQGAKPSGYSGNVEEYPGVITPHAPAMALLSGYSDEAIANLQFIASTFPGAYDDMYGFVDSVNVLPGNSYGAISQRFSAIAQGWLFTSLVNYLDGFIWRYFYRDAGVQQMHMETSASELPAPPSGLSVAQVTREQVVFEWQNLETGVEFVVERSDDGENWQTLAYTADTSFRDDTVQCGETYNYRVGTYRLSDSLYSAYSAPLVTTPDCLPDLRGTSLDVVPDYIYDEEVVVEFEVENAGIWTSEAFEIALMLSTDDGVCEIDDHLLLTQPIPALGATSTHQSHFELALPIEILLTDALADASFQPGQPQTSQSSAVICMIVDNGQHVSESNEGNNSNRGRLIDWDDISYFPWDINQDQLVQPSDLIYIINRINTPDTQADLNLDGIVTEVDASVGQDFLGSMANPTVLDGP